MTSQIIQTFQCRTRLKNIGKQNGSGWYAGYLSASPGVSRPPPASNRDQTLYINMYKNTRIWHHIGTFTKRRGSLL